MLFIVVAEYFLHTILNVIFSLGLLLVVIFGFSYRKFEDK